MTEKAGKFQIDEIYCGDALIVVLFSILAEEQLPGKALSSAEKYPTFEK
jgi:hypothetical protein